MKRFILLGVLLVSSFAASAQAVNLVWNANANADLVTNYIVFSAPPGSTNYAFLANTGTRTNLDLGASAFGASYYVRAQNQFAIGGASAIATNFVPAAPMNVRVNVTISLTMP